MKTVLWMLATARSPPGKIAREVSTFSKGDALSRGHRRQIHFRLTKMSLPRPNISHSPLTSTPLRDSGHPHPLVSHSVDATTSLSIECVVDGAFAAAKTIGSFNNLSRSTGGESQRVDFKSL